MTGVSRGSRFSGGRKGLLRIAAGIAAVGIVLGASACATGEDLSAQWEDGGDKGFVSGDGTTLSIPPAERTEPVKFSGTTDTDREFSSSETIGDVTVVNFWYAGCPPCRAEAPDLVAAYDEFSPQGVKFLGVNTRDQKAQSVQFAKQYGIEYPSILDVLGGRSVQQAFAGQVPLNAVPTTLVLDSEGRVAHRVLGQLAGESQLRTLIDETLAESGAGSSAGSGSGSAKK